jgi:cell wall-associated NlpC family hydrolase
MKRFAWLLFPVLAACGVAGKSSPGLVLEPGDPSAPSQVTPSEALAIAQAYADHQWQPFGGNILHGKDHAGVLVNTPDVGHDPNGKRRGWWVPGKVNTGIPYKWGGFDDPASFDRAIASGLAGGDVSSPDKRVRDNTAVSAQAAGVDCSGFVSRCLKLPTVHDTTQLPAVCTKLASAQDLRPGDVLNIPHRHVVLYAGWAKPDHSWVLFYETGGGPEYWKPALKTAPLSRMLALGYQPLHYRGMAREVVPEGGVLSQILGRGTIESAASVSDPSVGEP